jgi:hypothetical protein
MSRTAKAPGFVRVRCTLNGKVAVMVKGKKGSPDVLRQRITTLEARLGRARADVKAKKGDAKKLRERITVDEAKLGRARGWLKAALDTKRGGKATTKPKVSAKPTAKAKVIHLVKPPQEAKAA